VIDCLKVPTAKPWNCVKALMLHPIHYYPARPLLLKLQEAADFAGFIFVDREEWHGVIQVDASSNTWFLKGDSQRYTFT
jgi:hypothetical protein